MAADEDLRFQGFPGVNPPVYIKLLRFCFPKPVEKSIWIGNYRKDSTKEYC